MASATRPLAFAPTAPGAGTTAPGRGRGARRAVLKRILVGRQLPNSRMSHTLLPKLLALPVFSADALSSVAYCVESTMLVLLGASSAAVARLVMPIELAIVALMAIVVASYRQTVRAYPTGGGSYIVSKDNLGTLPGLIAAAALLTDYVLTVSVSVASGVLAIVSAIPALRHGSLLISLVAVALIAAANLRGVRESGMLFAFPVYGFIVSALALIAVGTVRCLHGCPQVQVPNAIPAGAGAVTLFVVLHAFSSGCSALTGTEAISNGIRAFRRPQARNAATTLLAMGVIAITMILGTGFLAKAMGARPSASVSVISEIAKATFPGARAGSGGWMFFVFQVFTFAILILAANTSFQDFPRLSAILARDGFMPRQFESLGDRLVFSNGVVILAVLSGLLLWAFGANLDALIQLYVVGVFTAFTLSQSGMVRHWLVLGRRGGPDAAGWRHRLVINAIGAVSTGIVTVIVVYTKFAHGAWIVILAVPLIVIGFLSIRRHYERTRRALSANLVSPDQVPRTTTVVVVQRLDEATRRAMAYARAISGDDVRAVHAESTGSADRVVSGWPSFTGGRVALEVLPGNGRTLACLRGYLRSLTAEAGAVVTVVVPEEFDRPSLLRAMRGNGTFGLKFRLIDEPNVAVASVPVVHLRAAPEGRGAPASATASGAYRRTVAIVLVSGVNDAVVRAVNYARSLRADEVRALHVALGPESVSTVWDEWLRRRIPVELSIVEGPFRELGPPILDEVRAVTSRGGLAAVVLPELVVPTWRHELLHNQRALFIKRLLLFEPGVVLTSVPTRLDSTAPRIVRAGTPDPSAILPG